MIRCDLRCIKTCSNFAHPMDCAKFLALKHIGFQWTALHGAEIKHEQSFQIQVFSLGSVCVWGGLRGNRQHTAITGVDTSL